MGVITLGRSPSTEFAGEFDADDFGAFQFPRKTGHDVDGIGTTDADGEHPKTTSIRCMGICSNHETTGATVSTPIDKIFIQCIILEDNLMDNS